MPVSIRGGYHQVNYVRHGLRAELLQHAGSAEFDRSLGDSKLGCHRAAGLPGSDPLQDLHFSGRQLGYQLLGSPSLPLCGPTQSVQLNGFLERFQQFAFSERLLQHVHCTGPHCPNGHGDGEPPADKHHRKRRGMDGQVLLDFQAAQAGDSEIQYDAAGQGYSKTFDELRPRSVLPATQAQRTRRLADRTSP